MGDDDQLRFGQVKDSGEDEAAGSGKPGLDGVIDLVIQLITLAIVLFAGYKIIEVLLSIL